MWSAHGIVDWVLPMEAQFMHPHPLIRENAGKIAIQRGPLVYCLEEIDNGSPLASLALASSGLQTKFEPELFGGVVVVEGVWLRYHE